MLFFLLLFHVLMMEEDSKTTASNDGHQATATDSKECRTPPYPSSQSREWPTSKRSANWEIRVHDTYKWSNTFPYSKCGMVKSILYIVLLHESECDMAKYFTITNECCVRYLAGINHVLHLSEWYGKIIFHYQALYFHSPLARENKIASL